MNDAIHHRLAEWRKVARQSEAQLIMCRQNFVDGLLRLIRKERERVMRAGNALLAEDQVELVRPLGTSGAVEHGGDFRAFALRNLFRREKKLLHGCESAFGRRQKADAQGTVGGSLDVCGIEVRHCRPDFLKHMQRHTPPFYAVDMGDCTNVYCLKRAFSGSTGTLASFFTQPLRISSDGPAGASQSEHDFQPPPPMDADADALDFDRGREVPQNAFS